MNKESQHIEWKESWHEKYYKWICGFANANGGKLLIGINDSGDIEGSFIEKVGTTGVGTSYILKGLSIDSKNTS